MTAFIHDDIEFVMPTVFKATMLDWAEDMIANGTIYFTNIKQFAEDPDPERGDKNEGKQCLFRNGIRCDIECATPTYVWCCTLDSNVRRVMQAWEDKNCVIQILDTLALLERIKAILEKTEFNNLSYLAVGTIIYNKTTGGHQHSDWVDGIFQKDNKYDGQKEFRLAFTGATGDAEEDHIIMNLGSCRDIVKIVLNKY